MDSRINAGGAPDPEPVGNDFNEAEAEAGQLLNGSKSPEQGASSPTPDGEGPRTADPDTKQKIPFLTVLWEFLKFNLGGLFVSAIEYGVYSLLLFLGVYYQISYATGNLVKIVLQFIVNQSVVFKKKGTGDVAADRKKVLIRIVRSLIVSAFMLVFKSVFLIWFIVEVLRVPENPAYFVSLVIETPLSFCLGKFFTFKD